VLGELDLRLIRHSHRSHPGAAVRAAGAATASRCRRTISRLAIKTVWTRPPTRNFFDAIGVGLKTALPCARRGQCSRQAPALATGPPTYVASAARKSWLFPSIAPQPTRSSAPAVVLSRATALTRPSRATSTFGPTRRFVASPPTRG
jgi:hypothetical protein